MELGNRKTYVKYFPTEVLANQWWRDLRCKRIRKVDVLRRTWINDTRVNRACR